MLLIKLCPSLIFSCENTLQFKSSLVQELSYQEALSNKKHRTSMNIEDCEHCMMLCDGKPYFTMQDKMCIESFTTDLIDGELQESQIAMDHLVQVTFQVAF